MNNTYEYGTNNLLLKATNAAGLVSNYSCNGLGFRVGKQITESLNPMIDIDYVLDLRKQYNNLLQKTDDTGKQSYTWDNFSAVSSYDKAVTNFYVQDELGSPIRYIDDAGDLVETYGYDEFGNRLYNNAAHQPFGFTGYQFDDVVNTYFAQAREYDPATSRMISADTHWNPRNMIFSDYQVRMGNGALVPDINAIMQSNNLYMYCMNNPVVHVDYTGCDTYGAGFNGNLACGLRIGASEQIVWDDKGNIGVVHTISVGGGSPAAGLDW